MKAKIRVEKEIDIGYVEIEVPYDEDDEIPEGTFGTNGWWLRLRIDVDTGMVCDWCGPAINIYLKVVDRGFYCLRDKDGEQVAKIEQDYVPNSLIPGEYGEYIDLKIGADGKILNWPKRISFEDFFPED